jgi:DNA-binding MltR family transcriptional regulator
MTEIFNCQINYGDWTTLDGTILKNWVAIKFFLNNDRKTILKSDQKIWITQKNLNNDQNFSIVGSMEKTKQLSINQLKFSRQKPKSF